MNMSTLRTTPFLFLCIALLGTLPAPATPLPGSVDIQDLVLTKDWVVSIDGEDVESAEIYYSDYEVAWLIATPKLGTLLLSPRGDSVQSVVGKAVHSKSQSTAMLKAGSTLEQVATFTTSHKVMSFELDGKKVDLKPAPPLLGRQNFGALEERHPQFEEKAAAYRGQAAAKAMPLKSHRDDLMVRVFFGSWSPICARIIPKIIAVEKEWQSVRFEYYGVPKVITDDELAKEQQITGVPTVVILRDGEEVNRYTGRQLDDPVDVLERALTVDLQ